MAADFSKAEDLGVAICFDKAKRGDQDMKVFVDSTHTGFFAIAHNHKIDDIVGYSHAAAFAERQAARQEVGLADDFLFF